jgi:hypothetical protein
MSKLHLLFILIILCSCSNSKTHQAIIIQDTMPIIQETKPVIIKNMTDKEFIERFSEIGYFDYTEKSKLKLVQDSLRKHFNGDKEFFTEYNRNPPFQFYDSRFYSCGDGEELYEEGGAVSLIKEMQPFLNKIGIQINYLNDSYVNNSHSIVVNGRTYVLAQGSPLMWGETIAKFAEMINAELDTHNSKERLYLLTNENEYMVFLTKEQYDLIGSYFLPDKRPLTVSEWTTKALDELNGIMNK